MACSTQMVAMEQRERGRAGGGRRSGGKMDPLNSCAQASHFLFLDLTLPISKVRQQFSQKILPRLTFEDSVNATAQTSRDEDIPTRVF